MIIAEAVILRYPDYNEGRLSRLRASLVREEPYSLQSSSICQGLFDFRVARVVVSAPQSWQIVLEALIGAIYLDSQNLIRLKLV